MQECVKMEEALLGSADPEPVEAINPRGRSIFFLTCEHGGRALPASLGDLGVAPQEMDRHIASDVGVEQFSRKLSARLDAPLLLQRYSRLVIDCNRPSDAPDSIVEKTDGPIVPGNLNLSRDERRKRYAEIHMPFHEAVGRGLDARQAAGLPSILVSVHSFTPKMKASGVVRANHLGLLFNRDGRFARSLMAALQRNNPEVEAAFNEPYSVDDVSDYTIPVHGERRGIPHVLLEIRNDQIDDAEGQDRWAEILVQAMRHAAKSIEDVDHGT
jgi:predicted N-formylglutamate amidohydrolase